MRFLIDIVSERPLLLLIYAKYHVVNFKSQTSFKTHDTDRNPSQNFVTIKVDSRLFLYSPISKDHTYIHAYINIVTDIKN